MTIEQEYAGQSASLRTPRFDAKWIVIGIVVAAVAWLALVPLVFLVWQSFLTPGTAASPAVATFGNYIEAYTNPETFSLFVNSVVFAFGTATLALVVGGFLAWLNERTNTPFKMLFYAAAIVPLVIPGILFTVAWIMLASPKIGIFNLLARNIFGIQDPIFDVYSMGGMIWVDGLHYSPVAFLLMSAAFRAMDPSLEESAMMSGASIPQIAMRITFKLAWPAVLGSFLILFVRSLESFEVPALLGLPVGIQVFTSSIYKAIHEYPSNVGLASAYAITLLAIASFGIYFQSRLVARGSRYSTVTGKGFRPRPMDLGVWRVPAAIVLVFYTLLVVVLPFLVLLWSSLQKYYSVPSYAALKNISFAAYIKMINYPTVDRAVINSLILSLGSAALVMLMTSVICWIVVRTKLPGRWLLDNLASLPMVFPGLVLGLSVMICYLYLDIGIYGTLWIMLIAYVTRFMPYGMRYNMTSMLQIHKELEESAAMSGAGWLTTFWRILLPLLKPGLLAGWIYVVVVSVRELSSSVLLYSSGSEVVSIVIWELWQNGQYVELSAFGVMLIAALFVIVIIAQLVGRRFGVSES
ncbi:iron ABC transporter permease [Rhizobium sp. P32RR-XVIII]|uniref:ABC transporter permease n=1 Tax=Rhizobium sp. P32RR-XVIII TaxID=2726738 RepID=UPI001456A6CF|nr:iron ABC transporter permease [Rhizobium sp. P32RR-XVIII]NLS07032.1 iron ABC transporter permease [Rhizobium sp. P32RR-XVIII]